jgi:hypothetical protein
MLTGSPARWLPGICLLALMLLAPTADARVYKYVDRDGDAHYTDSLQQVPLEFRSQVRDISPELEDATGFHVVEGLNGDGASPGQDAAGMPADLDDLDVGDLGDLGDGGEMLSGMLESFGFGIILLLLLAIPVLYVISALIFRLACSLAGEDPPGLGRACVILLAQGFAGGAAGGLVGGIAGVMGVDETASIGASIAVAGASTMISWMVNAAILASMQSYDFLKSMWIGFLHTLLSLVIVGVPVAVLVFIAFLAG